MPYRRSTKRTYGGPSRASSFKRTKMAYKPMAFTPMRRPYARLAPAASLETKSVDQNLNLFFDNAYSSNSCLSLLNGIYQGNGPYERVGRKVYLKSLRFNYIIEPFTNNPLDGISSDRLRLSIVLDRKPQSSIPTYDTIFSSQKNDGNKTSDIESFPNMYTTDRFRILHDRHFSTGRIDGGATQAIGRLNMDASELTGTGTIKLNLAQLFKSASLGIADIESGAIYLVLASTSATLANAAWQMHGGFRLTYTD